MTDAAATRAGERGERAARGRQSLGGRRWSLAAGACLVVAVVLWIVIGVDAAFVAATLGVLAWFMDQRDRLSGQAAEAVADDDEDETNGAEEVAEDEDDESDGGEDEEDRRDDKRDAP